MEIVFFKVLYYLQQKSGNDTLWEKYINVYKLNFFKDSGIWLLDFDHFFSSRPTLSSTAQQLLSDSCNSEHHLKCQQEECGPIDLTTASLNFGLKIRSGGEITKL